MLTLIQAQDRYIRRVLQCHPGHLRRVTASARKQLREWAEARDMDAAQIVKDAADMAKLENDADD